MATHARPAPLGPMPVGATPPLAVHALGADLNVYAYVGGQTFAAVDPWGLDPTIIFPDDHIEGRRSRNKPQQAASPPPPSYPPSAPLASDPGVPPVFGGIDPGVARQLFNLLSGPPAQNLANAADAARKKNATLEGFGRGVLRSRLASVQEDITIPIAPMLPPGASPASIVPPNAGDPGEEAGEQFEKAVTFVARIALGGVAAGAATSEINPTAGSIRNVNPTAANQNCTACAIATDATLGGSAASAVPGGPFDVMESMAAYRPGSVAIPANGPAGIRTIMTNWGPGARGIVWGTRGPAPGHAFNVVNQGGTIRFLDGQTGGAAVETGFDSYYLFRTH